MMIIKVDDTLVGGTPIVTYIQDDDIAQSTKGKDEEHSNLPVFRVVIGESTKSNLSVKWKATSTLEVNPTLDFFRRDVTEAKVQSDLQELADLETNWDGCGAPAIDKMVIEKAKGIAVNLILHKVPITFYAPLRDGGLQVELDGNKFDIEIEVHPKNIVHVIMYNKAGEVVKHVKTRSGSIDFDEIKRNLE